MGFKAQPNQLNPGNYDATVGELSTGADYNDIQDAINAGKYNLLVIGVFTQPTQISNGSNFVQLTIAERLKFTSVNFNIGSAGIRIKGEIETSYTSGSNTLFTGTGTLDISNAYFFDTSTGGATVSLSNMPGVRHIVDNCRIVLANNQNSGFNSGGNNSSFSNMTVIGGGSNSNGFARSFSEIIIDNVQFDGVWDFTRQFVLSTVASDKFIMTNCMSTTTGNLLIQLTGNKPQLSNLTGKFDVSILGSDNGIFSDLDIEDLSFDAGSSQDNHYFSNVKTTGTNAITLYGDYNQFVNCNFNAAFTLPASSNNNQLLLCTSAGGFTDNGTDNNIIEDIKQIVNFGKVTTINAATYNLVSNDYILDVTYTTTGAVTINLPSAQALKGRVIHIKDAGGNAGTYNILINAQSGGTIDGAATATINANYDSISLYSAGSNTWFIF